MHRQFTPQLSKNPLRSQWTSVFFILCSVAFISSIPFQSVHASHRPENAPKIANLNLSWSIESDDELQELAEWDVIIIDIENEYYSRRKLERLKELNPEIKLFAYISLTDIRPDAATLDTGTARQHIGVQLDAHPEWITRLKNGKPAEWWPEYHIFNITKAAPKVGGKRFEDFYSRFIRDAVVKDTLWDGIFYDNLWEGISFVSPQIDLNQDGKADNPAVANRLWRQGVKKILKRTRAHAQRYRNGKFVITGNGGTQYHKQVNGVTFEHFPTTVYGPWTDSMKQYAFIITNGVPQQYVVINSNVNNTGNQRDYKKFRFGLMSTLLNDGYYSFDNGDGSHHERWYYDEYDAQLGDALSGAYNLLEPDDSRTIQPGVWRRDFEYASIFVNSTERPQKINLYTGYEKLHGTQDPLTNSGGVIGSITIPAQDGILLLNRLTHVRNGVFFNGAFAKIWNREGKETRSNFFAYDGSFSGGVQVYKDAESGRTIVAGDTEVSIYDARNQRLTAFAPYGNGYVKGINMDVDVLRGGTKKYIVTANRSGIPHVRIFDMNGRLVQPGCFPFGTSFKGGASIAIGDIDGNRRQEIIVGAGSGGAPVVRILSNTCDLISTGFTAFSASLRTGVSVASGDLDGNGKDEIIVAPGPGGAPQIRIFNKNGKALTPGFFAYKRSDRSGVFVSTADIDENGIDEIITNSFSIFTSSL